MHALLSRIPRHSGLMLGAFLALTLVASTLQAQQLRWSAPSNYGSVSLSSGFTPDPHSVRITSGGSINVSALNLGSSIRGYATEAPDYELSLSGNPSRLRIFFVADDGDDTTLIINTPGGSWVGNDDYSGLNPLVEFSNADVGTYDIWVGSYQQGENVTGTLYITELNLGPDDMSGSSGSLSSYDSGSSSVNVMGSPTFGTAVLEEGFLPDPRTVRIVSGGEVAASSVDSSLRGYLARNPDYRLTYNTSIASLRVFFVPDDGGDTTLAVNLPNGRWMGNDDYEGLDPLINLSGGGSGQYDIWVGSYSSGESISGTLYITELHYSPDNLPGSSSSGFSSNSSSSGSYGSLNINGSPNFGTVRLNAGFTPDPHRVRVTSGGTVDASNASSSLRGWVSSNPDVRLRYSGSGASRLRFFFVPDDYGDTTIVVNTSNGQWLGNDDYSGVNPMVEVLNPNGGQFDIWVGSYSEGDNVSGTLYITELSYDPSDY